jgi:hypothetical protein
MLLWQEIDLGVLAACIGELLHKFVLSLVEPSCSGVPEIMLIKRVRGGKLPRAHGTGRLILTVPNNPLLTGMSNHSWQLRNQFYFAIYVHLFSFFYWFYCPYMSLYVLIYPYVWLFFILQYVVGVQTWWSGFASASPTAQDAWPQTASWNGCRLQKVQPNMRSEISNLMWSKSI